MICFEILKNNRYPDTLPQEEEGYVDNIKGGADSTEFAPMTENQVAEMIKLINQGDQASITNFLGQSDFKVQIIKPENTNAKSKIMKAIADKTGLVGTELEEYYKLLFGV